MALPPRKINVPVGPRKDGLPHPPAFTPLHKDFKGRAQVMAITAHRLKDEEGAKYTVDLSAGTCTCKYGDAFSWSAKKNQWVPAQYCSHKIRMMAAIVENAKDPYRGELQRVYAKAVGSRYNMYEVVSAFHKELRRGSVEHAVFWGHMLANFRGIKGVLKYMSNILYEETRNHELAIWLMQTDNYYEAEQYTAMLQGIKWFCLSTKKWELPHRMTFLEGEMRGYARLIKEFGRDVAKAGDIIPVRNRIKLMDAMLTGIVGKDITLTQYGLKGLQKLQCADIDSHRAWIINTLMDKFPGAPALCHRAYLSGRAKTSIGYHDLNMFVDSLSGEHTGLGSWHDDLSKPVPTLRLGVAPNIPIYAHDNHTWAGKALLRRFPEEWQPGAIQKNYDLRLCGAYMGVVWRHLAFKQHGNIECEWGDVKWPKWLSDTVANLWY